MAEVTLEVERREATGKEVASNREFLMVPLIVAFSADGASVFAASGDKFVNIIDTATGKTVRKLDRTTQPMQALDVSPDGASIATIFMKSEDMTQPDHVVVRAMDSWQQQLDCCRRRCRSAVDGRATAG